MTCVIKFGSCQQGANFKTNVSASWQEKFYVLSHISLNILMLVSGIRWSDSATMRFPRQYFNTFSSPHSAYFKRFTLSFPVLVNGDFFSQGLKNQARVKLNIVRCPPVTTVLIRRPDLRYQLGFSVQNGIVSSFHPRWLHFNVHEASYPFMDEFQYGKGEVAIFSLITSRTLHKS